MRVLRVAALTAAFTIMTGLAQAAVTAGQASASQAGQASPAGQGGCYPVGTTWICIYSTSGPGSPGSGGSGKYTCTYSKASAALIEVEGVGPPQPGYQWDVMTCPGPNATGGQLIQVSTATGTPAISPFDLLKIAIGDLRVPTLSAATAPPRGRPGLVGLPEWFWVPRAQWAKVSVTISAGPVWATAVAAPARITFVPGGGLPAASCAGPGTPFSPARPASAQHTSCSYTYAQSSAGQPGHSFHAALAVTWTISWTGSGGAGGVITNGYTTSTAFSLRVAQAEALVTTP